MSKKIILLVVFVALIAVVIFVGSSYYSTLMQMQENRQNVLEKLQPQLALPNIENGSIPLGDADAPITIVEFGDYQCEACWAWFQFTRDSVIENYIDTGKAKLIFLDMAWLGHDSSIAAQASHCAGDQGLYWEYHSLLYNVHGILGGEVDNGWVNRDSVISYATDLGVDVDEFTNCIDSEKYSERIKANYDEAVRQGVTGTPTFIVISPDNTSQVIPGAQPYASFEKVIESML